MYFNENYVGTSSNCTVVNNKSPLEQNNNVL